MDLERSESIYRRLTWNLFNVLLKKFSKIDNRAIERNRLSNFYCSIALIFNLRLKIAPIAQLDRASDYESEGWGFEFLRVYAHNTLQINGLRGFSCPRWATLKAAEMHGNARFDTLYCAECRTETFFQSRAIAPPSAARSRCRHSQPCNGVLHGKLADVTPPRPSGWPKVPRRLPWCPSSPPPAKERDTGQRGSGAAGQRGSGAAGQRARAAG